MNHNPLQDRNFDDLAERFDKNIYGSVKGKLRMQLVWDDMLDFIPEISEGSSSLSVLDAGGGFGYISERLAQLDHSVVLCDLSEKMLDKARDHMAGKSCGSSISFVNAPFQELPEDRLGSFDLITFHAVLEWLENPEASLNRLMKYLKPGGKASVMFYNLDCLVFQNAMRGNFKKIMAENFRGDSGGLTPVNPIRPSDVTAWIGSWGMELLAKTGIRVVYDYMYRPLREKRSYEDMLAMEKKLHRQEPYASMGRYVHMVIEKK